jgi:catechol 2,3-dioxygenase-like lactoylglutathione lyase family enzyme
MKIRTIYFKVPDTAKACDFWSTLLLTAPHKDFDSWKEINCGNIRLGFLQNPGDVVTGSSCVPVFEFSDDALPAYIERARALGAQVVVDGLNDPHMKSIAFRDPFGHEFELSRFHD